MTLAVAILAAATPAIEDAQIQRTETTLTSDLQSVRAAATALAASEDAIEPPAPSARRVVAVDLPERDLSAAAVESVSVDAEGLTYRIVEGPSDTISFDTDARVIVHPRGDHEAITLTAAGRHRLVLSLRYVNATRTVHIERLE
ncbi:MAG: hypothetical protein ACLFR6_08940 [Salinarchaeum sp.]